MKSRTWKMLQLLLNNTSNGGKEILTAYQLAQQFNVSKRTILNDLNEIKDVLKNYNLSIVYLRNQGYLLSGNGSDILRLQNSLKFFAASLTAETRRQQIIIALLLNRNAISINELSKKYHVSRSSVARDFKVIRQNLMLKGLDLVSNVHGTQIIGHETTIREVLRQEIKEYKPLKTRKLLTIKPEASRIETSSYMRLVGIFNPKMIEQTEKALISFEQKVHFSLSDIMYLNLVTHVLIIVERNRHIQSNKFKNLNLEKNLTDKLAVLSDCLNQAFSDTFTREDIQYLGQHLVMSGIQDTIQPELLMDYLQQFDNGADNFAKDLIYSVSELLNVDLTKDRELYLNLRSHCLAMLERLKNKQEVNNPLLNQIKENYAALFGVIVLGISRMYGEGKLAFKNVSESEIGFFTIHFQASLEKNIEMKKIIIVCPEGVGFSRLIQNKINSMLPLIKVEQIVAFKNINNYDLKGIDFIVSTIQFETSVPVVQVSGFLDENDINRLNTFVIQNDKGETPNNLIHLIREDCLFTQTSFSDKNQIINFMTHQMLKLKLIDPQFVDSVHQREKVMSTEIGHGLAIPHGNSDFVRVPAIGVLTLNDPVVWGKSTVDVVFLLALKFENSLQNKNAINSFYSLVNSRKMIQKIRQINNKNKLYQLLTINFIE